MNLLFDSTNLKADSFFKQTTEYRKGSAGDRDKLQAL
jgi:hypothetical protein